MNSIPVISLMHFAACHFRQKQVILVEYADAHVLSCFESTIEDWHKLTVKLNSYTESLVVEVVAVAVRVVLTVVEVVGSVSGFVSGSGWGLGGWMWLVRGGSRMWVKGSIGRNKSCLLCKMEQRDIYFFFLHKWDRWHMLLHVCPIIAPYNFSRSYLRSGWRLLLLLESLGTILFTKVKNHESCVNFPHRQLVV